MAKKHTKLELTWIGKGDDPKLEPRILIEDPTRRISVLPLRGQNTDSPETVIPTNDNLLIHGDNLLALKALEQEYTGKIKCVYIDPPYNTGNAFTHYDDGVEHSLWLQLIKPRLELIHKLLDKDSGSLWVSIDADESHYLKVLCDEIFGRSNFIDEVIWQRAFAPINLKKTLSRSHDAILVYAKNANGFELNKLLRSDSQLANYKNPDNDPRGLWTSSDCTVGPVVADKIYELITPSGKSVWPPNGRCWLFTKERMQQMKEDNRIFFGPNGSNIPRVKKFLTEVKDGVTSMTLWLRDEVGDNQEAKREIKLFNDVDVFDTPKPERLLQRILTLATNPGDWVLDSFLGSGTTAAVAQKMGRRWIGIELGQHAYTHCYPRLKAVCEGTDPGGISKAVGWAGGGGFRFYSLAPSLLREDKWGNLVINETYNADQLAAAMAKQEGFRYQPHESLYWKQAQSSEQDFLFTTTQFMTVEHLDRIHEEMQPGESLLICCKSFQEACTGRYATISLRKIPVMLLGRCEFNHDDYSFIINSPLDSATDTTNQIAERAVLDKELLQTLQPKAGRATADRSKPKKADDQLNLF